MILKRKLIVVFMTQNPSVLRVFFFQTGWSSAIDTDDLLCLIDEQDKRQPDNNTMSEIGKKK